ncbi:MAG: glutamine--tRNA ligase/YqeY domain fusion protein [Acidimicrobiales bacterium]
MKRADHRPGASAAVDSAPDFIRAKIIQDQADGTFGGRVHTRFPPEPNGFLHIGHAKAININFGLAADFGGRCNLRFDDTNPETEDEAYMVGMIEDLAWLGYRPDGEVLHASDYFEQLYTWALDLIDAGLAYVDDSDGDTISAERGGFGRPGIESAYRNRSIAENHDLFARMRAGEFPDGSRVLRAKIDMQSENMQLRDPVMYRIRRAAHPRTGTEWCIYPTYDWAHGQSDAIEGITHSLCSLEFSDHRALYDWFLSHLTLPFEPPEQTVFARHTLTYTITSKRKLRQLVEDGSVDGWDDPRMQTLRGLRRRGYPPAAIRAFMDHIGVARTNSVHDIELLESFVRTELNRTALRRMAVLDPVELVITNWPDGQVEMVEATNNPEDPTAGTRQVPFSGRLWIERDDVMLDPPPKYYRLGPGREVRLRAGYYVTARDFDVDGEGRIVRVHATYDPESAGGSTPDGRKVRSTIHWVSADHALDGTVALYDRLFTVAQPEADGDDPLATVNPASRELRTGAKLEPALAATEPGQVVQFERLGYFAADPDRPGLFHRTVGLRDEWANIQKRRNNGGGPGRR